MSELPEILPSQIENILELPDGWIWTISGVVCSSVRDGTHTTPKYVEDGIPLITSKNLRPNGLDMKNVKLISHEDHLEISKRSGVDEGDVLFAMIGTIGNPIVVQTLEPFSIKNVGLFKKNESIIISKYMRYWFLSQEFLSILLNLKLIKGTTQKFIPLQNLRHLPIPLAPLAEQKRIADKLDALLARVDRCRARLDRVPLILKRFRQAVLAAATSGQLTEDWRVGNPDVEPAIEMIARISKLSSKPTEYKNTDETDTPYIASNLPESWILASVESIGQVLLGRQRSPENHNGPYMRPYMRAANITWNGWNFSDVMEMNFDPNDFEKFALQIGDVLINEGSGSADEVGKPAIWKGDIPNCCFQNTLLCVRPYENMSQYLYFLFLHTALSKAFVSETRGVNIFHIGKQRFSSFLIPIPPLEEQHEIVRRVEILFAYAGRLEARYQAARAQVARLTPALLAKAFRGELVAQDPADEPAALLLERLRGTRG